MNVQFQDLEPNRSTIGYVMKQLRSESTLSALIAERIRNDEFEVSALLPLGLAGEFLYDFEHGGICGCIAANEFLVQYVLEFMKNEGTCIFLIEDSLAKPRDLFLSRISSRYFTYDEKVYFFAAGATVNQEELYGMLKAANKYPFLAYLCREAAGIAEKLFAGIVQLDELRSLNENAVELFVGAYDEETYLRIRFV